MKKVIKVVVYFDDGTYQELNNNFFTSPPVPTPEPEPWEHPLVPKWPQMPEPTHCGKCGIKIEGVMGYYCPQPNCPCGLGGITCGVLT